MNVYSMQFFPRAEYKKKYYRMAYVSGNVLCTAKRVQQILIQAEICIYNSSHSK